MRARARDRVPSILALLVVLSCREELPQDPEARACHLRTGGTLSHGGVDVIAGSTLGPDDRLHGGEMAKCTDGAEARAAFESASDALGRVPPGLHPARLVVHLGPSLPEGPEVRGIAYYRPAGVVFVERSVHKIDESAWLREIARILTRGERPRDLAGRRLFDAVEEGVCVWFAAVLRGSPVVAGGAPGRPDLDLGAPAEPNGEGWATLEVAHSRFDSLEVGSRLARALWSIERTHGTLVEDLIATLATANPFMPEGEGAAPALDELVRRCPERSRASFSRALEMWVPAEIGKR
jgi:hypothetical protein